MTFPEDTDWMKRALVLARHAERNDEVPVGAVVVRDGRCLGEGWNRPVGSRDPSAHAEITAIRAAAAGVGNYRLPGAVLYVTLEPCVMCAGAIVHARIARLVYAAPDPKTGGAGSVINIFSQPGLNHHTTVSAGCLQRESSALLREFFRKKR